MRYTNTTLKKLEEVFEELGYTIRYEKGNFQSGYCLVENRKIAVINRFLDTEARINALADILSTLDLSQEKLSDDAAEMAQKVLDYKRATADRP